MRFFASLIVVICLLVHPAGRAFAQSSSDAPRGAEPIPGYSGLYVADATRFIAGAVLFVRLTQTKDVREFLGKVKTCVASREVFTRLRSEGLNSALIRFSEAATALRSGACDVFVARNFDFAQLDRRFDSDDVNRDDSTRPNISPPSQTIAGQGRTATVRAGISDPESGIRSVFFVHQDNKRIRMSAPQGSSTYTATVNLPRDFAEQSATIVATNSAGLSARARVTLRLMPWCGPRVAVSNALVKDVQENLACVGNSPGGSDGALGPNTCTAIGGYLRNRMESFNAGGIRWTALRDELERACIAVQPVRLDVPGAVEVDSPRANVRIGLRQAGSTSSIQVNGPGIGNEIQTWRGRPLFFDLPMPPPGQTAAYRVQALGPEGNPRDTATLRLIRPPVAINVRPSGSLLVDQPTVDFTVTIPSSASAVSRIEARRSGANTVSQIFNGGSEVLSLSSPNPGASDIVTFVAVDRSGLPLAEQAVTLTRPEPIVPPSVSLQSPSGTILDASTVQLRVVLENAGEASDLIIRRAPDMLELARRSVGNGLWDVSQDMPPPGQGLVFHAQAVNRSGVVLAEDTVRVERPAVRLQVQPTGRFEDDADLMTAQATVTTGADWIETMIARGANNGSDQSVMAESTPVQGAADLQIAMPTPGAERIVEIVAIGRDSKPYASAKITLVRPTPEPVTLLVTSPDGFEIEASVTRLSVEVINPAETAVIVVSDAGSNQVLSRGRFSGEDWLGQINMPEPGQSRALLIEAQDTAGQTLASSRIMLLRPAATGLVVPPWAWIAALILGGTGIGYIGARLRGSGRAETPRRDPTVPPPRPRVFAEPDEDPSITLAPSAPSTLAVRIDEDDTPEVEVAFEENKEP